MIIRAGILFLFVYFFSLGSFLWGYDSAQNIPPAIRPYPSRPEPLLPPQQSYRRHDLFRLTALQLTPAHWDVPTWEVQGWGSEAWTVENKGLEFNRAGELALFQSRVQLPDGKTFWDKSGSFTYSEKRQTPTGWIRASGAADGRMVIRKRTAQKAETNPAYDRFKEAEGRLKTGSLNESGVLSKSQLSPPSKELVTTFKEEWLVAKKEPHGFMSLERRAKVEVEGMEYEGGRHLSGYKGQVTPGKDGQPVAFAVHMDRNFEGGVTGLKVSLKSEGSPPVDIHWKVQGTESDAKGLAFLAPNAPVPILAGPGSQIAVQEIRLQASAYPVSDHAGKGFSPHRVGDVKAVKEFFEKEALGIRVNVQEGGWKQKKPSSPIFGFGGKIKKNQEALKKRQAKNPEKFIMIFGLQSPEQIMAPAKNEANTYARRKALADQLGPLGVLIPVTKTERQNTALMKNIMHQVYSPVTKARIAIGIPFSLASGDMRDQYEAYRFSTEGPGLVTVNGVLNGEIDARFLNDQANQAFKVKQSIPIKNGSHFLGLGDLIQIVAHETFLTIDLPSVQSALAIKKGIRTKGEVFVVAHSQGTSIVNSARPFLTSSESNKVHFLGLGGQRHIGLNKGIGDVENHWFRKGLKIDLVPVISNTPMNILRTEEDFVSISLDGKTWTRSIDAHSFRYEGNNHKFKYYYRRTLYDWANRKNHGRRDE